MLNRLYLAATGMLVAVGLALAASAGSAGANRIRSMTADQFEQMLNNRPEPTLVVFMASWCAPCIKELPDLNALSAKHRPSGLTVIGVSLDGDGSQAMQPFIDRHKVGFPVYWIGEAGIDRFKIRRIPLLWFVRNGRIVRTASGIRSRKTLDEMIVEFMGGNAGG
jgi:thiol-disulfide isomerase/thioredoxin